MKIELNLTNDQVFAVAKLLEQVFDFNPTTKPQKVMQSLALELSKKFTAKSIAIYQGNDLFNDKKKNKISLKVYEAAALEDIINNLFSLVNNEKAKNGLGKIRDFINQKLA